MVDNNITTTTPPTKGRRSHAKKKHHAPKKTTTTNPQSGENPNQGGENFDINALFRQPGAIPSVMNAVYTRFCAGLAGSQKQENITGSVEYLDVYAWARQKFGARTMAAGQTNT
jgi:hypothetical protein